MAGTSSNLIIFGVVFTIIGLIGTVIGTIMTGAIPPAMRSTFQTITSYIFEPLLVIGIIILVLGVILYTRRPGRI